MASPAHCFYCFEVLSASFERRDPPTLQRVLDLYEKYLSNQDSKEPHKNDEEPDEISGQGVDEDGTESEEEEEHDEDEEDEDQDQERANEDTQRLDRRNNKNQLQTPSISRLQTSGASSRSSSASSPSVFSASSSNSRLTNASSAASLGSSRPTYASQLSVMASCPLFVTWNTISRSGNKSLRGCIGTFEALPLANGLSTYALTSAFDDTRFSPIPASLMPALGCSLTFLADFEPCSDAMDWTLGTHGLRISFNYRNRRHGATYLPDVAVEQGWNKDETVESLMRKAGWDGGYAPGVARRLLRGSARGTEQQPSKPWEDVQDFRAVRYTGLKSSATYTEWQEWRDFLESSGEVLR